MHICVGNLTIIGGILLFGHLGTNFSKILIEIITFSFKKIHLKVSAKRLAFCLGLNMLRMIYTVYPKKYAHGFCFAVLCCGYTLTDFPISIRLTSLALWQSNDCLSASKAPLMNMDKYFMWIHYERLRNHNKAKHNKNSVHISWDIL